MPTRSDSWRDLPRAMRRAGGVAVLLLCGLVLTSLGGCATPTPAALKPATEAADIARAGAPLAGLASITPTATTTIAPAPPPRATGTPLPSTTPRPSAKAPTTTPTDTRFSTAEVVAVVDGDTIKVVLGGVTVSVRYVGMDTPEMGGADGETARQQNSALVSGQTVRLERDVSETDHFGRLLRYVWVGDLMINMELVRLGYARAAAYPPDTRHQPLLESLQREADAARRGLWATAPRATQNANLRAGPGTDYLQRGSVTAGQALQIVGRDGSAGWYQLAGGAWIAGQLVANTPSVPVSKVIPTLAPGPTQAATAGPVASAGAGRVQIVGMLRDGLLGQLEPDEYVELRNLGGAPQALTGWRLESERRGSDDGQVFRFPQGLVMQPGQVCRVYTAEVHLEWCSLSFGHSRGAVWANSEPDAALLYNGAGNLVSRWE